MVVVFGGVGNLWGTLVGALSLGVLNKFLEPTVGAVLGKILVLVLIILFIQKRPRGLFPQAWFGKFLFCRNGRRWATATAGRTDESSVGSSDSKAVGYDQRIATAVRCAAKRI